MEELLEESLGYQSAMLYNTMLRGVMFDALYKVGNGYYIGRKGELRCIVKDNGVIVYPWVEMKIRYFKTIEMFKIKNDFETLAVSTCKCTARKVKEYFRKNTQKGYENLIFLSGDGLFFQQLC